MHTRRLPALLVAASLAGGLLVGLASGEHRQSANGHVVSFDHKTGNEWWVEVVLRGEDAARVTGVESRDDGGDWRTLTYRDWGAWAGSYHIEPGHRVQFRASFSDGTVIESCWFTHPAGAEECDGSGGGEQPPADSAYAFDHKTGNEWWVEVLVSPRPNAVQAMDTGGSWKTLTLRDWGAWAASFHIEPGHDVRFRAQDSAGVWHESCWFSHPDGVQKCETGGEGPAPDEFDATFRPKAGNEWWVEVYVDANEPLAGVDARVVGGEWKPLTKRSWGAWAGSFHVPDGSHVEFRARSTDGDTDVSGRYVWPGATAVEGTWPYEGSYVRYLLDSSESVGGWSESTMLWMNLTYRDGAWGGTCEGWHEEGYEGNDTRTRLEYTPALPPPTGPEHVELGEQVSVELPSCSAESPARQGSTTAYVQERTTADGYHYDETHLQHGRSVEIPVWRATYEDDGCPCQWRGISWHPDTGLVIDYGITYRYSGEGGHLVDTDAPISRAESDEPPKPAWPQEGSFVEYQVNRTSEYSETVDRRDVRFVYTNGEWRVTCTGRDESYAYGPPMAPTTTSAGENVRGTEASVCYVTPPPVVVQGQFPQDTYRNGEYHLATVWWGDESSDTYGDEDAWWDVKTGLLLKWEDFGGYDDGDEGWLTNTDAPLSGR